MALPWISVVTPSLNQGAFLEGTIRSVLSQGYPRLEYVVMDGGSTDESLEILQRYDSDLTHWVSAEDTGQAQAINRGWMHCSGEVVAWLNADDQYTPNALATIAAAFARFPDVDLVYSDCLVVDGEDRPLGRRRVRQQDLRSLLLDGDLVPQPTVFLRRRLLERAGWLDESLHLTMDYHLWLRAFALGTTLYLPHQCLAVTRVHPSAKSVARADQFARELVRTLELFFAWPQIPAAASGVKGRALAMYLYASADKTITVDRNIVHGLLLLARSVLLYPPTALRLPAALWRTVTGTRQGAQTAWG